MGALTRLKALEPERTTAKAMLAIALFFVVGFSACVFHEFFVLAPHAALAHRPDLLSPLSGGQQQGGGALFFENPPGALGVTLSVEYHEFMGEPVSFSARVSGLENESSEIAYFVALRGAQYEYNFTLTAGSALDSSVQLPSEAPAGVYSLRITANAENKIGFTQKAFYYHEGNLAVGAALTKPDETPGAYAIAGDVSFLQQSVPFAEVNITISGPENGVYSIAGSDEGVFEQRFYASVQGDYEALVEASKNDYYGATRIVFSISQANATPTPAPTACPTPAACPQPSIEIVTLEPTPESSVSPGASPSPSPSLSPSPEYNASIEIASETTEQGPAVVGQPVKWVKKIVLTKRARDFLVALPPGAQNATLTNADYAVATIETTAKNNTKNTKNVVVEGEREGLRVRGEVGDFSEIEVEYYTAAPQASEKQTGFGSKRVVVSAPVRYENVNASAALPLAVKRLSDVELSWVLSTSQNLSGLNLTEDELREISEKGFIAKKLGFEGTDYDENGFARRISWVIPELAGNQTFEINITVLNVHSHPQLYGNWTVNFETNGIADLTITATRDLNYTENYTRWSDYSENGSVFDLRFLEIRCGDRVVPYEWIGSNCWKSECSVRIANFSCNETASENSLVLKARRHVLRFDFGGQQAFAYNDEWTTPTSVYDKCDENDPATNTIDSDIGTYWSHD
ncbi:MAG: hypothetical protein V1817_01000, partial [Candidatus Micrarchaeota archaeon]